MNRILMLPITVPLRVVALQLRVARGAAEMALGVTRDLADAAPWNQTPSDEATAATPPVAPIVDAAANGTDAAEASRRARRAAAVQRTRARTTGPADAAKPGPADAAKPGPKPAAARSAADAPPRSRSRARKPPAATTATDIPPQSEEAPRPRPRRAARKATAARPARKRSTAPGGAKVAAARAAERSEEPVASAGPATGAGPEIHIAAPWEGYDAMALDEVLARLADADETLLALVRLYESQGEARQAILLVTETP